MAPTQQSVSAAASSSNDRTTNNTCDNTNSIHTVKESYSSSSSSSSSSFSHDNDTSHNSRLNGVTQEEMQLPISFRGHFFHDDLLKDAHQQFESAVRNVLDRHSHDRSSVHDDLTSYRILRQANLTEESQAATVTENNTCHQVVMDVRDFMAGDVKVKVVNEDEVVVEGSVEQSSGGSVSKKSFRRSFNFPVIKAADITSTMSSDGVLTVTVPKKENVAQKTNIIIQDSSAKSNTSAQNSKTNSTLNTTIPDNTKSNTPADTTKTLAESSLGTSATTHSQSSSSVASSTTTVDNSLKRESRAFQEECDATTPVTTDTGCTKAASQNGSSHHPSGLLLPISAGGLFFQDSFFEKAHQEFEEAMKKVLHSAGESPNADVMTSYRSLREKNLTDENQAVSLSEDSQHHKVAMDVRDFMEGDVKVKVVNEDEVMVEGSVEQSSGGSLSKKSFRRSFTFPGLVKAADITSTMSSDGVLTVTVPKKEQVTHITNVTVQEANTSRDTSANSAKTNTSRQCTKANNKLNTTVANNTKTNTSEDTTKTLAESSLQTSATTHSQSSSSVASSSTTNSDNSVKKESRAFQQARDATTAVTTDTGCTKSVSQNGFHDHPSDLLLPIFTGGNFFQDSFFEKAHQEFEEAMKKVLHSAGESPNADVMTSYRSLRERNLKEENQAVSLSEDNQHHKVVIDVRDFMEGDVKVKVVNEDEVVVEGSVEQSSGGSMSNKSFRRSFTFPGLVKAADITSTMSSDGVLTVTVPKKEEMTHITNITVQEENTNRNTSANSAKTNTSKQCINTNNKLNITVADNTKTNTPANKTKPLTQSSLQTSATTHSQSSSSVASSATTGDSSLKRESRTFQQARDATTAITTDTDCTKPVSQNGFHDRPSDLLLPISTGGLFFQDSFFEKAHQEFEEAMKKVLHTAGESPNADVMTSYRSLRERNLTDENQAVSLSEDSQHHKVVIDVRDFMAGDVKVKVVNEDEVVVEGSLEQSSGGSVSNKSFRRIFTFPGLVKAADITSTMSSDGVLTVTMPKKESSCKVHLNGKGSKAKNAVTTKENTSTSFINCNSMKMKTCSSLTSVQDEASSVASENCVLSKATAEDKQQQQREVFDAASQDSGIASHDLSHTNRESSWVRDSLLPVFPKGPFFDDSFFEESRQHFEAAVKEALGRMEKEEERSADDFSLYRSLRSKNMTDESQAVKVTEDEHVHQVVLDVRDFQDGDVQVKVAGSNEVQVEGRLEKEEGGSKSSRSFRRRFHLPGVLDVDAVTSALSSDGILTIRAPKGRTAA